MPLRFFQSRALIGEGAEQQRPFAQAHQHGALHAADRGELASARSVHVLPQSLVKLAGVLKPNFSCSASRVRAGRWS